MAHFGPECHIVPRTLTCPIAQGWWSGMLIRGMVGYELGSGVHSTRGDDASRHPPLTSARCGAPASSPAGTTRACSLITRSAIGSSTAPAAGRRLQHRESVLTEHTDDAARYLLDAAIDSRRKRFKLPAGPALYPLLRASWRSGFSASQGKHQPADQEAKARYYNGADHGNHEESAQLS